MRNMTQTIFNTYTVYMQIPVKRCFPSAVQSLPQVIFMKTKAHYNIFFSYDYLYGAIPNMRIVEQGQALD